MNNGWVCVLLAACQSAPVTVVTSPSSPALVVSALSGATTEAGGAATFTVALSAQPESALTFSLSVSNASEAQIAPAELTLTADNWNTAQTVTVTGVDDDVLDGAAPFQIDIVGSEVNAHITGFNLDNEVAPLPTGTMLPTGATGPTAAAPVAALILATTDALTSEAGDTAAFVAVLLSQPSADVVVSFTVSPADEATISVPDVTFTADNWSTPRTVTLTGLDDLTADGTVPFSVSVAVASADAAYAALMPDPLWFGNTDDDKSGIVVTPSSDLTSELGDSVSLSIVLSSQPVSDVTFHAISSAPGEGAPQPATIIIAANEWNQPHTIAIVGQDDSYADGAIPYAVSFTSASADPNYAGLSLPLVLLSNLDDDHAGYAVNVVGSATTEAGGTAQFSVALTAVPAGDVTLFFDSTNLAEGTVSATGLLFTPATWATPQFVTVTGVDDAIDDDLITYGISFSSAVSSDAAYNGLTPAGITMTNVDNDTAQIAVSAVSGDTSEAGAQATFTVRLMSAPLAAVSMTLTSGDPTEGAVSPTSLIFPTGSLTAQTVTVTGQPDAVIDGDQRYSIFFGSAVSNDAKYAGQSAPAVTLINRDDDVGAFSRFAFIADDNAISTFVVNSSTGLWTHRGHTPVSGLPLSILAHPSGRWVFAVEGVGNQITAYNFDTVAGRMGTVVNSLPTPLAPGHAAMDPTGRFLYVVSGSTNSVAAYRIHPDTGALTAAGTATTGSNPTDVAVDPLGRRVYVANVSGSSVSGFSVDPTTGALASLGAATSVANGPASVAFDPSGRFLFVACGGANTVAAYRINASTGALTLINSLAAGTGPRSVAVDPRGRTVYVASLNSNTVSAYSIAPATGVLTLVGSAATGINPTQVLADASGTAVYAINITSSDINHFAVDQVTGALTAQASVRTRPNIRAAAMSIDRKPASFSPRAAFVYNDSISTLSVFQADAVTGLTQVGSDISVGTTTHVDVDPFGRFLFTSNANLNTSSYWTINAATSVPTLGGATAATGLWTNQTTVDPSGRFAYSVSLNSNRANAWSINQTTGALSPVGSVATGGGPVSIGLDPSGLHAYVTNKNGNDVSMYNIGASGQLTFLGAVTGATGPNALAVDPTGRFAYTANADGGDVSAFSIDFLTGVLTLIGKIPALSRPYDITVHPNGKFAYIADINGSVVTRYSINQTTGALSGASNASVPIAPSAVSIDASGRFLYVACQDDAVMVFSVAPATGALTPLTTLTRPAGSSPYSMAVVSKID